LFFSVSLFGAGINIQRNSDSVSLSWNTESNKYYSVFHSENLNGNFVPVENKYKLRNLNNYNYNFNGNSGFFKIVESDLGTVLGDFWNALNFGDIEKMIPGTRVRVYRSYVSDYATIEAVYYDIVFINESEVFMIWNDGDFEIGNYTLINIGPLSGTFNFFNRKAFYKPNARTEYPEDSSDTLVFEDSNPLNISRSYPDPDPEFTDDWTINEDIFFNYPSTLMANNLINKTYKVYAFSENTDYASYVELDFDTSDTGKILLASGETDISYTFEKLTHSVASLSFSFIPQIQILSAYESSINVDVTFFSYDAYSGYFYGTIESEGSTNEIYGYYGEESIPVDHLYDYPLNQIVILYDQNGDGLVTQEDAEIFTANNPGILWLYPSLGSLPSISEVVNVGDSLPIIETPYDDPTLDPAIPIVSPVQ
jgi:hypothetical protein